MRTARAATGTLLVLSIGLVGIGCSDDDPSGAADTTTTTTASTVPCELDGGNPARLEVKILDRVAGGFTRLADRQSRTGPTDLDKASDSEESDVGRQLLRDNEFRRGYQRAWTRRARSALVLTVYEFCTAAGASRYNEGRGAAELSDDFALEEFDVPGMPDAVGFKGGTAGYGLSVVFTSKGAYSVQAGAIGNASLDALSGWAAAAVEDQLARL